MTDYHWTPALQRQFLESLAETGSVELACKDVSMTRRAAYNLRWKREGTAFRIGWEAAILISRAAVADELMDRALLGQQVETVRDPENHSTMRIVHDRRLGYALLARLDRMAERAGTEPADARIAHIVSQDFEAFLELIAEGGQGAQAGLFVAARGNTKDRLFPGLDEVTKELQKQCELARESADSGVRAEPEETPESAAAEMKCWYSDENARWQTDFPPREGFTGWSQGGLGSADYVRELDSEEEDLIAQYCVASSKPYILAGRKARDVFFDIIRLDIDALNCCPEATAEA